MHTTHQARRLHHLQHPLVVRIECIFHDRGKAYLQVRCPAF